MQTESSGKPKRNCDTRAPWQGEDNKEEIWGQSWSRGYSKGYGADGEASLTFREANVVARQQARGKVKGDELRGTVPIFRSLEAPRLLILVRSPLKQRG